ncbi:MAG TPA: hypothetical protein VJK72_03120, partial [Candidatus Nanoarchaeia archaeon]|nr:hypothetical protein [Candidatus Nanoarchaeia archaeon]
CYSLMFTHKAQMEVLGLAIVVLLVSLSLLFVLQFVINREDEQPRQIFTRDQLASTMVNSLLETTTSCADLTMTELLQDCAQQPLSDADCDRDGYTRIGTRAESCVYAEGITSQIFADTLDAWDKKYEFNVKYGTEGLVTVKKEGCPSEYDTGSALLPLVPGGPSIFVVLRVC